MTCGWGPETFRKLCFDETQRSGGLCGLASGVHLQERNCFDMFAGTQRLQRLKRFSFPCVVCTQLVLAGLGGSKQPELRDRGLSLDAPACLSRGLGGLANATSVDLRAGSRQGLSRFSTGKETQVLTTIFRTKYQQPLFTPPPLHA